jgi:inner membrane protein
MSGDLEDGTIDPPVRKPSRLARLKPGPLTGKLVVVALVTLLLSWLLAMVESLVYERESRYRAVSQSIGEIWGKPQTLAGPVLALPFGVPGERPGDEHARQLGVAYFLPESLDIETTLVPETRKRGIFETVVYSLSAEIKGRFTPPALSDLGSKVVAANDDLIFLWGKAFVAMGISDMRSIGNLVQLEMNGQQLTFAPGTRMPKLLENGMSVDLPSNFADANTDQLAFKLRLDLNGSHSLRMIPLGTETRALARSSWPSPSFNGAYLPNSHELSDAGFSAAWRLSYFGRGYPQVLSSQALPKTLRRSLAASAFGVDLHQPVTPYRKVQRAIKYGLLFLAFTFAFYFLMEISHRARIHPVQYATVGVPLCLFFLLLVAFSEHIGFVIAYVTGAGAVVTVVALYSIKILQSRKGAAWMTALLIGLYSYLYTLLEQENYSLLWGAVGLFGLSAAFMYVTRNIDWYGMNKRTTPAPSEPQPNQISA